MKEGCPRRRGCLAGGGAAASGVGGARTRTGAETRSMSLPMVSKSGALLAANGNVAVYLYVVCAVCVHARARMCAHECVCMHACVGGCAWVGG